MNRNMVPLTASGLMSPGWHLAVKSLLGFGGWGGGLIKLGGGVDMIWLKSFV